MTARPPTARVGGLCIDCELCGRPTNHGIRIINREFLRLRMNEADLTICTLHGALPTAAGVCPTCLREQRTAGEQEVPPPSPVVGVVPGENNAATQESP